MAKITFEQNDITYGKYVAEGKTPEAILVPQGNRSHLIYGITLVPATEQEEGDDMHMAMPEHYEAERIEMPRTEDYGKVVSALIREKYSADEVEAIVLNHGDGDAEHDAEYKALQEWRSHAKEVAKQVLAQK